MHQISPPDPLAETFDDNVALEGEGCDCRSVGRIKGAVRVYLHGRDHVHVPRPSTRGRDDRRYL